MNAIGGFVPSSGSVELMGADVSDLGPALRARRGLGRSFQAAALFPELTVRDSISVALEARGRSGMVETLFFSPRARRIAATQRSEASELIDFLGPRALCRPADLGTLHRHPAHRRTRRAARPGPGRVVPRRTDRRHRPARSRSDGSAADRHPQGTRLRDAHHRTRHAPHHEHERPRLLPRTRQGHLRGRRRASSATTRRSSPVTSAWTNAPSTAATARCRTKAPSDGFRRTGRNRSHWPPYSNHANSATHPDANSPIVRPMKPPCTSVER